MSLFTVSCPSEACSCISLSGWQAAGSSHMQAVQFMSQVTVMYSITIMYICSFQVLIASIMCSYNREDWTELSKMAEVMVSKYVFTFFFFFLILLENKSCSKEFLERKRFKVKNENLEHVHYKLFILCFH